MKQKLYQKGLKVVKCLHVDDVYHFHNIIDMLVGCGYKKGTTLFGFGYDFRQRALVVGDRIGKAMDGLKAKLETASKASGGRKGGQGVPLLHEKSGKLSVVNRTMVDEEHLNNLVVPSYGG
ncbi:Phospholipase A(1) LCAT3, partial [Cucurbita argyrosperma subsp. argyrosperma]